MAAPERLYTLYHPKHRNRPLNGSVSTVDATGKPVDVPYNVHVDGLGYVRNVTTLVAEKLSRCGYELHGGDAGLIAFEGAVGPFLGALDTMKRAEGVFRMACEKALDGGVALESLQESVSKYRGGDAVNLAAFLGVRREPVAPPAPVSEVRAPAPPVPSAQPVDALAEPPADGDVAEAPAASDADSAALANGLHWKAAVPVARALGAEVEDGAVGVARAFIAAQPADKVREAIDSRRQSRG